jgi:hypothetical protein
MRQHDRLRLLVVIDPLPGSAADILQLLPQIHSQQPQQLLWVVLTGDLLGLGFESCHYPFTTPGDWLQRTEQDMTVRLRALLAPLSGPQAQLRLLPGAEAAALATLAGQWQADAILLPQTTMQRLAGELPADDRRMLAVYASVPRLRHRLQRAIIALWKSILGKTLYPTAAPSHCPETPCPDRCDHGCPQQSDRPHSGAPLRQWRLPVHPLRSPHSG